MQQSKGNTFRSHSSSDVCSRKQNLQCGNEGDEERRPYVLAWVTLPLPGKKQDRHQRECREKDWQRELPNIFDEAWRRHACMFGDCFHEQIWSVADVSQCAKKGGA